MLRSSVLRVKSNSLFGSSQDGETDTRSHFPLYAQKHHAIISESNNRTTRQKNAASSTPPAKCFADPIANIPNGTTPTGMEPKQDPRIGGKGDPKKNRQGRDTSIRRRPKAGMSKRLSVVRQMHRPTVFFSMPPTEHPTALLFWNDQRTRGPV